MADKCVILLALVAGALAGPLSYREEQSKCALLCPESSKFSWQIGKTYEYQYEADVKTQITGAMEEHSSLHIRATALVEVLAPCEMALRLSDVSLQDSLPSQYESRQHVDQTWEFKKSLQERALRFAFLDGQIESVCPEEGDETWVLNLKKGIISAFQNTQNRFDENMATVESDVAGRCPVEYEVEGSSWGTTTVKKTKDLLGCTERMGHFTAFQSTPYNVESAIQSLPLMKSTHECRQQIKNGILTETSCSELHVFRPFSRDNKGAMTEVSFKLSLYKENGGVSTGRGPVSTRDRLLFEHEPNAEETVATAREAQQTLEKLCRKSVDEIGTDVPRLFKQLVHQMRRLDARTLQNFHRSATGTCDKASKFIRDAIPVLGTSASVTLIRDLILADQVSDTEAKIWLTSMAFVANPTKEMLNQVKPLLSNSHNLRKSVLAVSTMVHSYCRQHEGCDTEPEVGDIVRTLEDNLRYNCRAQSDDEHDLILMSLKAIGNVGHATRTAPTITRCFRNQDLATEIRVAALQAFRRMSCDVEMSHVKELLANSVEDSELRIQAYLTLMQCPDADTLAYVARILADEQMNQVGSFIWTHLTNLMETSNPHRLDAKSILADVELKKKFDLDKRKFSRNVEWSTFSQLLNVGGTAEGNLIWSEKSFVPRSASLNLTVEMFGESVNLLEVGARVQGLERMLEKVFAEQDNSVERRKRSTDEIATMDRRYNYRRDSTQASYYVRVFGNEIRYDDFHGFDLDMIREKLNYLDWLIELSKEHKIDTTRTMMFLDADLIVPTAVGLPLRLNVDGVSSVSVSVTGKLDIRQMFSSLSTFDIDGTVRPSASLEINGEMGIDAHVARTGIKMKTTLHTSTLAEGKIQMQNGKIFNLDLKPPQDNTQIINAEKKFFVIYRDEEREQRMLSARRFEKNRCTSAEFATITGLELCGELSLPWPDEKEDGPWFVFRGPASAKIVLNKKDSHDKYLMEVKYVKEKTRQNDVSGIVDTARIYMDTPGSRVNRKLLVDFKLDRGAWNVDFDLDTPWKKATLQGGLTNTAELKRFYATSTVDGRDSYSIDAELAIDERSYSSQYVPKVEIRMPGRERILISGDVRHRPGKKAVFSVSMKNVCREPIKASGTVLTIRESDRMRYETELEFNSQLVNGKLAAFVDDTKERTRSVSSKLDLEYTYRDQPPQAIKFEERFVDAGASDTFSYTLDSSWSTTLIPRYNGDVHFDYNMNKESLSTNLNAGFDETRRLMYTETATFSFTGDRKFDMNTRFQFPYKNIDYSSKLAYLATEDQLKISGSAKYDVNREGSFEMMLHRQSKKPLNVMGEAKLVYPGRNMAVSGSVQERGSKIYHQTLVVQLQKYDDIRVNSVYKMEPRHELSADITIPDVPKITIKAHLNPELRNVQAHAEVGYDGKTYLSDVNWAHSGNGRNFNTRADAEVAYPERSITARGSVNRQGSEVTSEIETKWDASRDAEKKFTLTSKFNIEATRPSVELHLNVYPSHFVNLNANGKYETGGWYRSESDVEGSISLQTSFEHLEDISASFVHDRTPKVYKNRAEVSWRRGEKIAGSANLKKKRPNDWSSADLQIELTTPFRGARSLGAELSYDVQKTTLSTNVKAKLEEKEATVAFNGELDAPRHRLSGELELTSPFADFEAISVALHHADDGRRFDSDASVGWAPGRRVSVTFGMQHRGRGFSAVTNSGELSVATPFAGYERAKASWRHEHDAEKLASSAELRLQDAAVYGHNVAANVRRTSAEYAVDVQATIKARDLDEISLAVEHSQDRSWPGKLRSDWSLTWKPSETITFSCELDTTGDRLLAASAKLTSPFRGFRSLALNSNTRKTGETYATTNEFKWATNKKLTLSSELTLDGYEFELTGRLTTPFDGLGTVVVNGRNRRQDGVWASHVDVDYGKRIELDTEFSDGWRKMVSVRLQSACPYVHNLFFRSEVKGGARDFQYQVDVSHEKLASGITWSGVVKTADVNRIKLTSDLATPFRELRSLNVAVNYIKEGDSVHLDASVDHPSYKGKIIENLSYRPGQALNTNTVVEYLEGKKIQLEADIKIKPTVSVKATWKSPIDGFEQIELTLNHEGSLKSFSTAGELSYGTKQKIAANANFDLSGDRLTGRAMLTTPYRPVKRLVLNVDHRGPWKAFANEASLEFNRKRLSEKCEFSLSGNDELKIKAEVLTPFDGYETITFELTHAGPPTDFSNEAMLTYGNRQLSGSSELRLRRSSLTANLALQLPFRRLSNLNLNVVHTGRWSDFNNKLTLTYNNNKKIVGKTNLRLGGENLDGKVIVKTPFSSARTLGLELKHEGPATNFKNGAVLTLNDKEFRADSELTVSGSDLALKASATSPSTEIKSVSLELNHRGPIDDFSNSALFAYNEKKVSADGQLRLRGNSLVAKANLASPWVAASAELNHDGPAHAFRNNAVLGYNGRRATASSEFGLNGDSLTAKASLDAPNHKLTIDASHNGRWTNFRNDLTVDYNGAAYRAASQFGKTGNRVNGKLEYSCPDRAASAEFNHRGKPTNFNNDMTLMYDGKKIEGKSKFKLTGHVMTAEGSVEMPDGGFSMSASHDGPLNDFKNNFNAQYNGKRIRGNSEFRLSGDKVALKATLSTPYRRLRSASIELDHQGSPTDFSNSGAATINGRRATGKSEFRLGGNELTLKGELTTPSNRLSADVSHSGPWTDFNNNGLLTFNDHRLTGSSTFRRSSDELSGKATLNADGRKFELQLNQNGRPTDFVADARAEYDGEQVTGSVRFSLRGDELSAKASLETTSHHLKPISIELHHNGPAKSFSNNAVLSYGRERATASSEFSLRGDELTLKADAQTTIWPMKPISVSLEHRGPPTRFTCRATVKYGQSQIGVNNDFSLAGNSLHLKSSMTTNVSPMKPISVELNHDGPATHFNTDVLASYGDDSVSGAAEFELDGNRLHLKATAQTTLGGVKPIAVELNHEGPADKFENTITISYGQKELSSDLSFSVDGNTISGDLKLQTPFRPIERVVGKFSHSGKNWRNFENNGAVKVNNKKYTGQSELRWFGKIFKLSAKINAPDEYSVKINHKGSRTDFSNNMKMKIPGEKISGTSSFKMDGNKIEGRANLDSTIRYLNNLDLAFDHVGDGRKFKSSFDLQTPFKDYKSFSGQLNHEGTPTNFRTTGTLSLPFRKLRNVLINANHQSDANTVNTVGSVSYDNKVLTGSVNYKRTGRKVIADAKLETPYSGYENFGLSMEHAGTRNDFQTSGAVTTSVPGYERFSGTLSHRGDLGQFRTSGEVNTPIGEYRKFGFNVEHAGNSRNFKTAASVTSSVPGYEAFGGDADYSFDGTNVHASGNVRTPFRRYERFGAKLDHSGSYNGFRTSVEATSSVPGYDKFAATVEKKGTLDDFELSSDVQTPFRKYEQLGAGLKYAGRPTNFRASGHVTTSVPGYEKFSASLNHNGDRKSFSTDAEIRTPVRDHDVYKMAVSHDSNDGVVTSATLEYPGKKYGFSLNHRGGADDFTSDLQIQTPHPGYERFGVSLAHSAGQNELSQTGTIRLPLRSIPEIKYKINLRGSLDDFVGSGTVEYSGEKIEGDAQFKRTSGPSEVSYDGTLGVTSSLAEIRDFRLTAKHVRKPREKSGTLDVTHNGRKTVDVDYDYTTSGRKVINIRVRQPEPLETRINFHGDGRRFDGDAYFSWQSVTGSGEFSLKNEPDDVDVDVKLVLPSRTLALKSGYALTETSLKHRTDLQWGNGRGNKLSYELEGSKTNRRGQTVIDGRLGVQSARISGQATVKHVFIPGRQYSTELALQTDKRMSIKSDLTMDGTRFEHTINVEHPEIRRGASIKTEGSASNGAYDGKIELHYNREAFTVTGRVADESSSRGKKYLGSFEVSHPNSGLDFQTTATAEDNSDVAIVSLESKYLMARERQHRISALRAEINKLRKELSMEIVTPIDTFHVSGRLESSSNGICRYTGEARCNHNEIRGELTLTKGKSADLKIHYNDNDYLQLTAKATPEQLMFDGYRMVSGQKIQEVLFLLQKDAERLVSGRTYWRPDMYREIRAASGSNAVVRQHAASWRQFVDDVSAEYRQKADYLRTNAKPFYRALVSLKKDIASTYRELRADAAAAYERNDFRVKDIHGWLRRAGQWTGSAFSSLKQSVADNYTRAKAVAARGTTSLGHISEQARIYTKDMARRLSDWWDSISWHEMTDKLKKHTTDLMDRVSSHPTVKGILSNMRDTEIWRRVQGDAAATSGSAESIYSRLLNRDDVQTGLKYLKKRVEESNLASKYFEVKKTIDGIVSDVRKNGLKSIRANVVAWLKDYLKVDKDRLTVGDGDVRFSLYVPLPLDDLRSIPKVDINLSQYLREARNIYDNYVPKSGWTFWDYYYNYKPSADIRDMIPPFKAHATISGNQHYMTFDKRFYEFAGDCSYLLARDFLDGTFSVIVNYERVGRGLTRKSLTVLLNGKTIVISSAGGVTIDNSRVEMPIQASGVRIVREENRILVENEKGVRIDCDLAHDRCTVEVSGWYYDRTAGLLGTYNNERADDWTSADRERLENVGRFAASWSLGSRCRPTNLALDAGDETAPETRQYDICAKYLEDETSPFRRCFRVVDPKPFMKMCLNDVLAVGNRPVSDQDTCDVAAFYVSECQRLDVPVRIPNFCVRCRMENGEVFSEGQNVTIRDDAVPNSADIVFVIHHSDCNRMMVENLKNIVDNLEKVFKTERLTGNRYAILGYGGPGVESDVHIHTMDGQVFGTRDKILLGLENFGTTSGRDEDAMAAVKYAANLPFRVGVSKNVILMPCAPCRQGRATFSELQQLLLFRDINLHVLMQYNFLFKGNKNAGTAYIFGVDRETVYTRKDAGTTELVGDSEIRSHVLMPKDLCVALTEETDGSVFNTLQFINSRPFVQKRFVDVLVRVIAEKAEPSDCQICDCKPDNIGVGKADCRHCVRPDPIYDIMPKYDNILLPPPSFQTPEVSKPNVPKSSPKKTKKSKPRKTKKQLNAKKRAMRERRLRRLEERQS